MKKIVAIITMCILLVGCGIKASPTDLSAQEQLGQLVHSIHRSEQYFSDRAMGLSVGESVPRPVSHDRTLILALSDKESTTNQLLIALVKQRWKGNTKACFVKQPEYELPLDWDIVVDEQLLRDLKVNTMPSLYIVEEGVVQFRMVPFMLVMWEELALALDGDYSCTIPIARAGEPLPQIVLADKRGAPESLKIGKPTVLVLLDTSCVICDATVEWLEENHKKINSEVVVVITHADAYRIERTSALQSACGEEGDHSAVNPEEILTASQGKADRFIEQIPRAVQVLFDNEDGVLRNWGIYSWPAVIVVDAEGRVVSRMVLSWGKGNLDGVVFADPLQSINGVLSRLK